MANSSAPAAGDRDPIAFVKGHGTRNDFLLVHDPHGARHLSGAVIRAMTDRRSGIGADGIIRIIHTDALAREEPSVLKALAGDRPRWFMDYRNADGSKAEMCGNGIRVFVAELVRSGAVELPIGATLTVGTRAGVRTVRRLGPGAFDVDMGTWSYADEHLGGDERVDATVELAGYPTPLLGLHLNMGNPHVVVAVPTLADLAAIDLRTAPKVSPQPEEGANVEIVVAAFEEDAADGMRHGDVTMRVFERGVGETQSCGTGACAAAVAVSLWADVPASPTWRVHVPGGDLTVTLADARSVRLAGPADLVAAGTWW